MKKFLKISLIIFLVMLLAVAGWFTYLKYFADTEGRKALSVIPKDAIFVVETSNLTNAWTEVSSSKAWKYLTQNAFFKDLEGDIKMVDTYLKNNKIANMVLSGRKLMISAHMTSGNEWDFIYAVDMQNTSVIKDGLKSALGLIDGYTVTERNFKKEAIIELKNNENPKDIIYMCIIDNILTVSFTGALLENAILQKDDQHWHKNKLFTKAIDNLGRKKLFRFYFNYAQLSKFSLCFLTQPSESIEMLGNSLGFSALNIFLEDEQLSFEGSTSIDSVGSYVKALAGVAPGKMEAYKIISNQAAMYFSIGFQKFNTFYENLINQYKLGNTKDLEDIESGVKITEKYLGISLKENFFDWIGNEIALVKLRPTAKTRMEDVVVLIQAKDIDKAKQGWEKIVKQVGKRTFVKFETENYKNFEIKILKRKGFFKLFFGKMFKNLEKPYYTYIENYLVLSNSLETLKIIIDDYTVGNTLSHKQAFTKFKDDFDIKSNISIFLQTPKLYQNLYYYSSAADRTTISENKEFILSFSQIGFQLVSKGDVFDTKLIATHDPTAIKADELEKFEKETSNDLFMQDLLAQNYLPIIPADSMTSDKVYFENFINTQQLKYEGSIKDGTFNGLWKTYNLSGNISSSVTYYEGKPQGEAFFFYDNVQKTKHAQATFKEGNIVGEYYEFYNNGARKAKIEFDDGKPDGDAEFYYKSGALKIEASYKNGLKHGKWKYYDEKGKMIGKEKWKKGVRK